MANPWIRLYREALHDPKIVTLSDRQHRAWHNCLLIARDTDGVLPPMRDVAVHMRVSTVDAEQLVHELVDAQLVDVEMRGTVASYKMHGWDARQYLSDNSASRVRKHRERKRAVTAMKRYGAVTVTPPDSDSEGLGTSTNYCSTVDRARESEVENPDMGSGSGVRVSAETRRRVAAKLGLVDAGPLVAIFEAWPKSRTARDPDAMFAKAAAKILANAAADVRAQCLPPPEEPLPPVQVSPQLAAKLKGNRR